jgi:hypothetical protein
MRPADVGRLWRYVGGVRRFGHADLRPATLLATIRDRLERRDELLLDVIANGVFDRPGSPYLALFRHAGVELGDVELLVREHGVDAALGRLRDVGVYVTPDEVRGRAPIVRPGLELHPGENAFDNPFLADGYRAQSGGSTGAPRKVVLDISAILDDCPHHYLWVEARGLRDRPLVLWRSVPPSRAGIRGAFRSARLGPKLEAWFTPTSPSFRDSTAQDWVALRAGRLAGRSAGISVPRPRYVPFAEADVVARWLADRVAEGRPPVSTRTPEQPSGSSRRPRRAVSTSGGRSFARAGSH